MKVIHKQIYGSRLFGTNTKNSDTDYKQIHIDSVSDIILKRNKNNINLSSNPNERNTSTDVDLDSKELRQFIVDCIGGQTYALDLLFSPESAYVETSPIWKDLLVNKDKILPNNVAPYIGYVRSQAAKYSKKGEKLGELLDFKELLLNSNDRYLFEICDEYSFKGWKHFSCNPKIISDRSEMYIFGPDCSFPLTRSIPEVLDCINTKLKVFGNRAKEALDNNGVDLKAYYHALRITWQMEEYLLTRSISFPAKNLELLMEIRSGKKSQDFIEDIIDAEIARVLQIPNTLPPPDKEFWNEWILKVYYKESTKDFEKYTLQTT